MSTQVAYSRCGFFLDIKFYTGFLEQADKGIIVVSAKADKSLYLGIDQHLGTEYARRMSTVNSASLKTDAVEASLDDHVLFSMDTRAYFMHFP